MKNLFSLSAVEKFIAEELIPVGYEVITIREGVLLDDMVAIAPDDEHYHIVFRAEYLNEWNSAYSVRRTSKISAALQKEIDAVYCA